MSKYAAVVVEAPVTQVYHYKIPSELTGRVLPGARVTVPFGHRRINGFCVEVTEESPIDEGKLKNISKVGSEDELVPPDLLSLTKWIASYYCSGWGTVLTAAVPSAVRNESSTRQELFVSLAVTPDEARRHAFELVKKAPKQSAVIAKLLELQPDGPVSALMLEEATSSSRASIKSLEQKGILTFDLKNSVKALKTLKEKHKDIVLNDEQKCALERVNASIDRSEFNTFLLYGVTGSGKTEVYLRAMQHALAKGRSVLVLVPEISLTPQTVERFRNKAGEVAVLHSNMSDGQRAETWRTLKRGDVRVIVGARSAVFAPLENLGLVIIDEEHEKTFKQDNDPRYNARDVAIVRARENNAVVILGSATPSLESWENAGSGKYELIQLLSRAGEGRLPNTEVVNLRDEWADRKQQVVVSRLLEKEIIKCLHNEEQVILFLNRRGFNTYVQCSQCGEVLTCENCDISLTYHRKQGKLRCHYCDHESGIPEKCPMCGARPLKFTGTGTERVEDIVDKLFPDARILRMDSDTMKGRDAHATALSAFAAGEYDILLGTQMVTKGFDFPNVTVVGVLSADSAINLPDFRAAERTFQLVTQVVGRAGRASKPGKAIIQAFQPDHYSIQYAISQDFKGFAEHELADRKSLGYPPYGKLVRLLGKAKDERKLIQAMSDLSSDLRAAAPRSMMVLGPSECALGRIKGEHRVQILVKAASHAEVRSMILSIKNKVDKSRGVRINIDVDPISML
ncbi:MAG: primosomal protein N' [Planctomycetes bacterium]|nr:primosomal protein N' [Planctomycetota bacterium]